MMDLQKAFDEGFEAVKSYVDRSMDALEKRVEDMAAQLEKLLNQPEPVNVKSALIDRENHLILTMTNGETKDLGLVVGKDGEDGEPGLDGLGFDDLAFEYDGEKSVSFKFTRGDQVKEFPLTMPIVLDRGVFSEGKEYLPGDGVTWGGSFWIAQHKTSEKPDDKTSWRLAVKKGRDGRDGVMKAAPSTGPIRVTIPQGGE